MQIPLNLHSDLVENRIEHLHKGLHSIESRLYHMIKRNCDQPQDLINDDAEYEAIDDEKGTQILEIRYGSETTPDKFVVGAVVQNNHVKFYKAQSKSLSHALTIMPEKKQQLLQDFDLFEIDRMTDDEKKILIKLIDRLINDDLGLWHDYMDQEVARISGKISHLMKIMDGKTDSPMKIQVETVSEYRRNGKSQYRWYTLPDVRFEDFDLQIVNYNAPFRIERDDIPKELNKLAQSFIDNKISNFIDLKIFLQKKGIKVNDPIWKNTKENIKDILYWESPCGMKVDKNSKYVKLDCDGYLASVDEFELEGDLEVDAGVYLREYVKQVFDDPEHTMSCLMDKHVERNATYDIL